MLYRAFPYLPSHRLDEPFGPLHVPRLDQGGGRHDNPGVYGALYLSRDPASAVAELLREYVGRELDDRDLVAEGARRHLAAIDGSVDDLVDLDDPRTLVARDLRPSNVATGWRQTTQTAALAMFEEGHVGLEWWSTIEASWINVTLFKERVMDRLSLAAHPEPLTLDHPALVEAADVVGVKLAG